MLFITEIKLWIGNTKGCCIVRHVDIYFIATMNKIPHIVPYVWFM